MQEYPFIVLPPKLRPDRLDRTVARVFFPYSVHLQPRDSSTACPRKPSEGNVPQRGRRWTGMRTFAFMLLAVALLGAKATSPSKDVPLRVNGQATIKHAADTAVLDLAIVTSDDDAPKATAEINNRYNDLRNRLHAIGLADGAISTTSYNVNFVQPQPMSENVIINQPARPYPFPQRPQKGYVVTRSLQITMTDFNLVGPAVDAAIAAKIGEVYNVQFSISNYRELYAQALKAAMQDAQRQAGALAQAANMHIARVSSIQTGGFYGPPMIMRGIARPQMGAPTLPTEIPPGVLDVAANVSVIYVLAP